MYVFTPDDSGRVSGDSPASQDRPHGPQRHSSCGGLGASERDPPGTPHPPCPAMRPNRTLMAAVRVLLSAVLLLVHLSTHPSSCPPTHAPIHPSIHPPIHPSVHPLSSIDVTPMSVSVHLLSIYQFSYMYKLVSWFCLFDVPVCTPCPFSTAFTVFPLFNTNSRG